MKYLTKRILFITALFAFCIIKTNPAQINVTFEVISNTNDSAGVYISGNHILLGNWMPGAVRFNRIDSITWRKTISLPAGTDIEYKFTRGTWDKEALNEKEEIPQNEVVKVWNDTLISKQIDFWNNGKPRQIFGQITGTVEHHKYFQSNEVIPRDIVVWLPPSYEVDIKRTYPVLYMHDGQNVFDPFTSSFGYDWQADETADSLIKADAIEEIIIVGIYSTNLRTAEYSNTDTGAAYMRFVVNELKPFIDKNYRTKTDRHNTAVAGSSLGGLISFMLIWKYPEIFSKTSCFSPAFKVKDINYLPNVAAYSGEKKPIKIYIDNGGVGLENELQPGIDEMLGLLFSKGYEIEKDLYWYRNPDAMHNEQAWAKRFWRALVFMFGK